MVEEESVGVRIANRIAIGCNIDDTIWYDDTTTMADEIDIELEKAEKKGRVEGAIGEIALMKLCIQNEGSWKGIQEHIEKRLKSLESGKE